LIAAVGFLLNESTYETTQGLKQGIVFFTSLIANPSTGKTPAMNLVVDCVLEIEKFRQIPEKESPLTNVASIEGLVQFLYTIRVMIGE
jgi:hypothetical protein